MHKKQATLKQPSLTRQKMILHNCIANNTPSFGGIKLRDVLKKLQGNFLFLIGEKSPFLFHNKKKAIKNI
jgi:hypothetical protein